MFGKRITLFRLFGFAVRLDASWVVIAVLVTWSLATHVFPQYVPDRSPATYWTMGVLGALGLFASIVFHEFAHSLVARRYGLQMRGITLFIFGGVAELGDEPPNPKSEFWVAVAGPLSSIGLGLVFLGAATVGPGLGLPLTVVSVFAYLAGINGVLVAFNIVPAFPLDGGRVLRSALWAWKGSLRWATRVVSVIGTGFALLLIALGLVSVLQQNFMGLWWVLLGLFLRNAAQSSYQQLLVRETFQGEPVRQFMNERPVTVPAAASVADLVEHYIYKHHHKLYPVVDDGRLLGCVNVSQLKQVPRAEWGARTVADLAQQCSDANTIAPETDAVEALAQMNRTRASRLMVVADGRLLGVVSLKDLLRFLSLKLELEG